MSIISFGTVFGELEYRGAVYKLLNFPKSDSVATKASEYRKNLTNLGYSSSSSMMISYQFKIIDKKLYLTYIHCLRNDVRCQYNEMKDMFGASKIPIDFTGILQIFSRYKEIAEGTGMRSWFYTIELRLDKGTLQGIENVEWKKRPGRILKNYIPV